MQYRAIERWEGKLSPNGKYIVMVNGGDEYSLAGELRNALRDSGFEVTNDPREATYNVNLSYATSKKGADARIDRMTFEVLDVRTGKNVAQYLYDRNNEDTADFANQIRSMIKTATSSARR